MPPAPEPLWSAAASRPITSAMPTGSLTPDSPLRMSSLRPATSRPPSTENITAGSVGATAAPISSEGVQSSPRTAWMNSASRPATAKVPGTPSATIGQSERRKRRWPMSMPPSNRITISATRQIRSTSRIDSSGVIEGVTSEDTDATAKNRAGAGTRSHSLSRLDRMAAAKPTARISTARPSSAASVTAPS